MVLGQEHEQSVMTALPIEGTGYTSTFRTRKKTWTFVISKTHKMKSRYIYFVLYYAFSSNVHIRGVNNHNIEKT